jgi:hypothetical protein
MSCRDALLLRSPGRCARFLTAAVALLVSTACVPVFDRDDDAPSPTETPTTQAPAVFARPQQDFDMPPEDAGSPDSELEEGEWRLVRTFEDRSVYLGLMPDGDFCMIDSRADGSSGSTCDRTGSDGDFVLISSTWSADDPVSLSYIVLPDRDVAVRSGDLLCSVANNVVIISGLPEGETAASIIDRNGNETKIQILGSDEDTGGTPEPTCV